MMPPNTMHVKHSSGVNRRRNDSKRTVNEISSESIPDRYQAESSRRGEVPAFLKTTGISSLRGDLEAKSLDFNLPPKYYLGYSSLPHRNINFAPEELLRERIHKLSGITAARAELHKQRPFRKYEEKTVLQRKKAPEASIESDKPVVVNSLNSKAGQSIRTYFFNSLQIKLRFITTLRGVHLKMGQTLSEPITKKESCSDENHSLKVGASCMQGWRINMEDEHVQKLCLNEEKDTHFFAVFDGHGGQAAAQCAAKQLDSAIVNNSAYRRNDYVAAFKGGFLAVDDSMNKESLGKDDSSGCTAVAVLIKGNKMFCANVGDSRAVASIRGHAQLLSFDHKPQHERELKRITAAGGFVEFNRVNGNLALSRALGDFVFKKNDHRPPEEQIVTADPDVIVKEITKDHEFIVIACDGIWDVLSNQDVVEFVRERLGQKMEPETICEQLMDRCLATECAVGGVGCDNMTVIIIALKQNGSFDELCKKCSQPKRDPIPPSCLLSSYPDYVKGGISCL
ncbi:unnamed protein product [Clavelina lepadiformis]|uniref:protein-serine/threonine phosphatase n=1 Tax=Clavelina lepadiformis TaxID=159417 RepID=A0ABP0FYR2_CLALP